MTKYFIYFIALFVFLQGCGNDSKSKNSDEQEGQLKQLYMGSGSHLYEKDQPFVEIVRSRERLIEHWPFVESTTHPLYANIDFNKDVVLLVQSPTEWSYKDLYINRITAYKNYVEVELALSRNTSPWIEVPYSTTCASIIYGVGDRPIRFTRTLSYHDSSDFYLTIRPDVWLDPLVFKDDINTFNDQSYQNLLANDGWVYNPYREANQTLDYETVSTLSTVNDDKLYIYKNFEDAKDYFNLDSTLNIEGKSIFAVVDNISSGDISYESTSVSLTYLSKDAKCEDELCENNFGFGFSHNLFPTVRRIGYKNDCDDFNASSDDKFAVLLTYTDDQNRSADPVYMQTIRSCTEYTTEVDDNMTAWLFENFSDQIYERGFYW